MNETENKNTPKLHHYLDCGLNNVWLEGGYKEIDTPYGAGIAIQDLDGLHRCIGQCLIEKPAPLSGAEFRFLRTELDLSQLAMGMFCGVNDRTIRNWESEDQLVGEPANTIIRHIYEQRFNPSSAKNYEERSKLIQQCAAIDKMLHETHKKIKELKIVMAENNRWKPKDCPSAKAA